MKTREGDRSQRIGREDELKPSVLDRLIVGESRRARPVLDTVKENVRRDLENLLNTRPRCESWPPELDAQLKSSLLNYGLPDLNEANLALPKNRGRLAKLIEQVIEYFEPRLKVERIDVSRDKSLERALSFKIIATLKVFPVTERISFNSTIDPGSANFEIDNFEVERP